jgi:hypothetical protein
MTKFDIFDDVEKRITGEAILETDADIIALAGGREPGLPQANPEPVPAGDPPTPHGPSRSTETIPADRHSPAQPVASGSRPVLPDLTESRDEELRAFPRLPGT